MGRGQGQAQEAVSYTHLDVYKRQHSDSVHDQVWPDYDENALVVKAVEIAVQVNGKLKDRMTVSIGDDEKVVLELAMKNEKVAAAVEGRQVKKSIYVAGKLLNIVVG